MANIPFWQLTDFQSLTHPAGPPTWMVVFSCPMDDEKRDKYMHNLINGDEQWFDHPDREMRRMIEVLGCSC